MIKSNKNLILSTTVTILFMLQGVDIDCYDVQPINGAAPGGNNAKQVKDVPGVANPNENETLKAKLKQKRTAIKGSDVSSDEDDRKVISDLDSPEYKNRFGEVKQIMSKSIDVVWNKLNRLGRRNSKGTLEDTPEGTPQGKPVATAPTNRPPVAPPLPPRPMARVPVGKPPAVLGRLVVMKPVEQQDEPVVPVNDAVLPTDPVEPQNEPAAPVYNPNEKPKFDIYKFYFLYKAYDGNDKKVNEEILESVDFLESDIKANLERLEEMHEITSQLHKSLKEMKTEIPDGEMEAVQELSRKAGTRLFIWEGSYMISMGRPKYLSDNITLVRESIAEGKPEAKNSIAQLIRYFGVNVVDGGIILSDDTVINDEDPKFENYLNQLSKEFLGFEVSKKMYYLAYASEIELFETLSKYYKDENGEAPKDQESGLPLSDSKDENGEDTNSTKKLRFRDRRAAELEAKLYESELEDFDRNTRNYIKRRSEEQKSGELQSEGSKEEPAQITDSSDESDSVKINSVVLLSLVLSAVLIM